jgi:mono/diheme cytochrome c family protein
MKASLFRRMTESPARKRLKFYRKPGDGRSHIGLAGKVRILLHLQQTVLLLGVVFCSFHHASVYAADATGVARTGSDIFLKYCAGCHGFDGFAEYELAPSFSIGERLHNTDQELLRSVLAGKHAMPHWENKLNQDMILRAISYLRVMEQRYSSGLSPRDEPIPETHYKFNPVGEDEDYWLNRE